MQSHSQIDDKTQWLRKTQLHGNVHQVFPWFEVQEAALGQGSPGEDLPNICFCFNNSLKSDKSIGVLVRPKIANETQTWILCIVFVGNRSLSPERRGSISKNAPG